MQRSASAGSRRCTPPPKTVQDLHVEEAQRRSGSSSPNKRQQPQLLEQHHPNANVTSADTTFHSVLHSNASSRVPSPSPRANLTASNSRGSSPSRGQYQNLVRTTYFGYETNYPNQTDLQRRERAQLARPPKLVEKPLDAKLSYFRGHVKCKHCSALVPFSEVDVHHTQCPLAPIACPLVDSETGVPCGVTVRGRELLNEHLQRCNLRTRRCENAGCGKLVSVQSTAIHLQRCSFERTRCTHCHVMYPRTEDASHSTVCSQALVACPLGCGETMRRGDVQGHLHNTLWTHRAQCVDSSVRPPDDPQSVIHFLLQRLLDMHDTATRRGRSGSSIPASVAHSRSATPVPQQQQQSHINPHYVVASLAVTSRPTMIGLPTTAVDEPPSTIHGGDLDVSLPENDETSSLRLAIVAASKNSHDGEDDERPLAETQPLGNHHDLDSHSLELQKNTVGSAATVLSRPRLAQPVQGILFSKLYGFLAGELMWYRTELDKEVVQFRADLDNKDKEHSAKPSDYGATEWNDLLSDATSSLKYIESIVDAFLSRHMFDTETKANGEAMQNEVQAMWKAVDRVWYEWKLSLYERMYLE